MRFLFWQMFSLPIAYIVSSAYLNIHDYIIQLNYLFRASTVFPESGVVALIIFLVTFMLPNLYVFTSLRLMREDLLNGKIQRDVRITPHERYIQISTRNYTITDPSLDTSGLVGFTLISVFPFVIDYSSLTLLLLSSITLAIIGTLYEEGSIVMNPYLRVMYHVFTLRSEDKKLYIIMEKEERPKFSEYVVDWYDHLVLVAFKGVKHDS